MHEKPSGKHYHARCWYEMKTGKPIDFPEHQLTWRMIELIRLLEVMDGHGEAASSSTILKQWGNSNADLKLIHVREVRCRTVSYGGGMRLRTPLTWCS